MTAMPPIARGNEWKSRKGRPVMRPRSTPGEKKGEAGALRRMSAPHFFRELRRPG